MIAKAVFTFFILLANLFVLAQNQKWEAHIGLSNRAENATDILEYYDEGLLINAAASINNEWQGWNVKTDINGIVLWDKTLIHTNYGLVESCNTIDMEGNIYIAGTKFHEGTRPFVTKINSCGEKVWCKILEDEQLIEASAWDILINENHEVVVLCNYISNSLEMQIYLECLDQNGEYLWKKQYATIEDHPWIEQPFANDLMEHNHEYYISGDCYWPFPSDTNHYLQRPLFIGIDSLFNEKWILPFYEMDTVIGMAYYSIPINDSIILGGGMRRYGGDIDNSLLAIYSTDGDEIGLSEIYNEQIGPDIHSNHIREIERINDTLFIAAALFGTDYNLNPGGELVFDTAGNLYHFLSHPNTGSASLIKTSDNNFIIASTIIEPSNDRNIFLYKMDETLQSVPFNTNTYTYDSLCPEPIQSGIIDMTDCLVWTGIEEIPSPEEYYFFIATIPITAYPNPAETQITLAFENTEHHSNMMLEYYNIYGQKIHSEKIYKGQQQTKLDVGGWSKGLYFAVVKSEGKVAGMGRFVRK